MQKAHQLQGRIYDLEIRGMTVECEARADPKGWGSGIPPENCLIIKCKTRHSGLSCNKNLYLPKKYLHNKLFKKD